MASSVALLGPLVALMRERVLLSRVIHTDDTSVPFLERGRDKTREGHLWVYIGDRDHHVGVVDFTEHYRRDGPEQFLKGYTGYLQADALAQYEGLFVGGEVIHVACNARARRRFVEAQASSPAEAEEALTYIRKLYKVEREMADRFEAEDDAGRQKYRAARSAGRRRRWHRLAPPEVVCQVSAGGGNGIQLGLTPEQEPPSATIRRGIRGGCPAGRPAARTVRRP
jgi:hypothetical protein